MAGQPITITVALLGEPKGPPWPDFLSGEDLAKSYAERPKVTLEVEPHEHVGEVLRKAAREWGAEFPGAFIAFYTPDDESEFAGRISPTVPLVDDAGRATWRHIFYDVPYRRLIESAEAGVLAGDPRRPYLVMQPGIGDGVLPDWATFKAVWDSIYFVLENVDTIGGSLAAAALAKKHVVDRLRHRTKAAAEAVQQHATDWGTRGGDPYELDEWLDDRIWNSNDLAELLDCTPDEAEALLWGFGFAQAPSGLWRRNEDPEAEFLTAGTGLGFSSVGAPEARVRKIIQEELEAFLESGQAQSLDWDDLERLQRPTLPQRAQLTARAPYYWVRDWWENRS